MRVILEWLERLKGSVRKDARAEQELAFHLEMEAAAAERRGLSREEATRHAALRSGNQVASLESVRAQQGVPWLESILADVRQGSRSVLRQKGFTLLAAGALTASVAASTVIFAMFHGVILKPLPYRDPERLVQLQISSPRNPRFPLAIGEYFEYQRQSRSFENIALYVGKDIQLTQARRAETLSAVHVTDTFFPTLKVEPLLGRNFSRAEMTRSARVAVLGYALWKTRFGSDSAIVGKTLRLDREPWTVIGVLPQGVEHTGGTYRSPLQGESVAVWLPDPLDFDNPGMLRYSHFNNAIARLKPGVSLEQARQELSTIHARLHRQYPDWDSEYNPLVSPLLQQVVGSSRRTIEILLIAGGLVLVIACANIAGLFFARGLARNRELAVRKALGAPRWRLISLALSESLVLALIGSAAGIALAAVAIPALRAMLPATFPRLHEIRLEWVSVLFAVAVSFATTMLAALVPALRQSKRDVREGLALEGRSTTQSRDALFWRSALVTIEVTLACVIAVGSTLLLRSYLRIEGRDPNFRSDGVLTFHLALPDIAYSNPGGPSQQSTRLFEDLVRGWRSIPGARAAAIVTNVPWSGYDDNSSFEVVGRPAKPGENVQARYQAATPGYFETLRIPLQGRDFSQRDTKDSEPVIVINRALADRYMSGIDPIGRYLDLWGAKRRIVAVAADITDTPSDSSAEPAFWFPLAQMQFSELTAVIGGNTDPYSLASSARAVVREFDPELAVARVETMDSIAGRALAGRRVALWLFEAFALMSAALAALGIFGLIHYVARQRTREVSIRIALGATRQAIVWTLLRGFAALAGFGACLGLLLAWVFSAGLSSLLYGIRTHDPASLIIAPFTVFVAAVLAASAPAVWASRIDPASRLREE
jgi:predicted permease